MKEITKQGKRLFIYGVISRFLKFTIASMLYILFLPYTGTLAIIGIISFIATGYLSTEQRLDKFSDWFNKLVNGL